MASHKWECVGTKLFLLGRGISVFQTKFCRNFGRMTRVIFLNVGVMLGWIEFLFFQRVSLPNALRAFGWVSGNWDPLKGLRRLPRVDPSGQGVTI